MIGRGGFLEWVDGVVGIYFSIPSGGAVLRGKGGKEMRKYLDEIADVFIFEEYAAGLVSCTHHVENSRH